MTRPAPEVPFLAARQDTASETTGPAQKHSDRLYLFLLVVLLLFLSPAYGQLWGWNAAFWTQNGNAAIVAAYLLLAVLAVLFARTDRIRLRLASSRNVRLIAVVVIIMTLLEIVYVFGSGGDVISWLPELPGLLVVKVLFVGLGEELAYRGYVLNSLTRRGSRAPIFLAAILFAVYHLPADVLSYGFSPVVVALLVPRVVAGMIFGWTVFFTGEIMPAVVIHGFYDATYNVSLQFNPGSSLGSLAPFAVMIVGFLLFMVLYGVSGSRLKSAPV